MPDSFIDGLVNCSIPAGGQRFTTLLKERREALKVAALQNPFFQDYLQSPQAGIDADNSTRQMNSFVSNGTTDVVSLDDNSLLSKTKAALEALQLSNIKRANTELVSQIQKYQVNGDVERAYIAKSLGEIAAGNDLPSQLTLQEKFKKTLDRYTSYDKACNDLKSEANILLKTLNLKKEPKDVLLSTYITNMQSNVNSANNKEKLQEICFHLHNTLSAVDSIQVQSVKAAIESLRKKGDNGKIKADRIEKALYETPLLERAHVISTRSTNEVQRALASHRDKNNTVYMKNDEIDMKKAARTFNVLKSKFAEIKEDKPDNDLVIKVGK